MEEDTMKRNVTLRKLMALVLSLVLTLSLTTAAFATGNVGDDTPTCDGSLGCQDGSHVKGCPLYTENTDIEKPDDPSKNVTPPPAACTEDNKCTLKEGHSEKCPSHPDNAAAIQAVQSMIDALPEEVTADNQGDVESKLGEIQTALVALKNDACRSAVNAGKKLTAETALASYKAARELENRKTALADLIAALPTPDAVTGENKEAVQVSLTAIEGYSDIWTEEQKAAYVAVKSAVEKLNAPAEPTPEEAAAALFASLPAEVTKDNAADVETILGSIAAYEDILTDDQRATRDAYQASVNAVRAQMNLDRVNELMGKLPEAGSVTAESLTQEQADAYKAQLAEIDSALLTLTDEQKATVDRSRYESMANALGSYYEILNMTDNVAEVDGKPYPTLQEAITNAEDNAAVTLLKSVDTGSITLSKSVTLNLGGFTLTGPAKPADSKEHAPYIFNIGSNITVTVTGGIIESYRGFNCTDGTLTLNGVTLTTTERAVANYNSSTVNIGSGTVVSSDYAPIVVWGDSANNKKPTLNVSGTVKSKGSYAAIQGNGGDYSGTTVNIHEGAVIQANTVGIYNPQPNSILNVKGGTISGATGIEMRAGTLNVSGGTIKGTAAKVEVHPNGNGSTTSGAGIAVAQHTEKQPIAVTISGGNISGASAVYESNPQGNGKPAIDQVSVNISNGNFSTTVEGGETIHSGSKKIAVSGGTFDQEVPADYRAAGFESNKITDTDGNVIGYGVHVCEFGNWVKYVDNCSTGGYQVRTCSKCNKEERETISGKDHSYSSEWSSNEAAHWHNCTVCSSKTDIQDHTFHWVSVSGSSSGTEIQKCTTCGYKSETDWSKLKLSLGSNRTTVRSGNTITYTLTVTNKTGKDMDEVVVSGKLDKNLTFSKVSGDGKYDSKTGKWTISNLEDGKSANLTLKVTVKSGVKSGTKLKYTASVTKAEAYNGEAYPDTTLSSVTSTVKVSSGSVFATNPKTGDPNSVGLWITVMAVSLAALIAVAVILIIKSRKKK